MKKTFVLAGGLMFLAAAAFAQIDVKGYVGIGYGLFGGTTDDSSDEAKQIKVGSTMNANTVLGRINATGETGDGAFGGFVRFDTRLSGDFWSGFSYPSTWEEAADKWVNIHSAGAISTNFRVRGWWKPIPQFQLTLGNIDQGAVNYIVGWGYFANDMEDYVASWLNPTAGGGSGWYGMTRGTNMFYVGPDNGTGLGMVIKPMSGLTFNVYAPVTTSGTVAQVYSKSHIQGIYDIGGIGSMSIAFTGGEGVPTGSDGKKVEYTAAPDNFDPAALYASFNLTAIEKLGLNFGLKYTLPVSAEYGDAKTEYSRSYPMGVALGAQYGVNDLLTVKARLATTLAGSTKDDDATTDDPFNLGFDIMPVLDLKVCKVLVNMGILYTDGYKQGGTDIDSTFQWNFNPIVTKSVGSGTFYTGLQLYSDSTKNAEEDDIITWGIPVGFSISF